MPINFKSELRRCDAALALARRALAGAAAHTGYARYARDPVAYAAKCLRAEWWDKQQQIARALIEPPYRVLVKASHSVGKSHVAAGIVNWWYDTRRPSIAITTAPTFKQVQDVLWKEIRLQRRPRGGFPGPKMPRLEDAPDHYAVGLTADSGEAVQGQHGPAVLAVIDEAVGVPPYVWEALDSMMMGVEYACLAICNPTDSTSEFYRREQQTEVPYTVISISCLDHPNIDLELDGHAPKYPAAVRLAWVNERILEWCQPLGGGEPLPTDIQWPPRPGTVLGEPKWYRPGPDAEARLLGRWPSQTYGVWSDWLFTQAEEPLPDADVNTAPVIGCDVARFGDDDTAIHVRCGAVSLHHEAINGQATDATAGRLTQLAREWAAWHTARRDPHAAPIDPKKLRIQVDDDGVGGGVVDLLRTAGYCVVPVNAACAAYDQTAYPNVRSELWFAAAARARARRVSLARLPAKVRHKLRVQAMAPTYKLDAAGRRVVEPKADTKKPDRLGRSPDDMDALNLAYYEVPAAAGATAVPVTPRQVAGGGVWGRR